MRENAKKKGIKSKVTNLVLLISLAAILVVTTIAIAGMLMMRVNTISISSELGSQAGGGSTQALEQQALNQLVSLTKSKAVYADAKLSAVMDQVMIIADAAADIYNDIDNYSDSPVNAPKASNEGIVTSQLLWAQDADLGDMPKLGNISVLLDAVVNNHDNVFCAEVGTEDGYIIVSDESSASKAGLTDFDPRLRSWYTNAKAQGGLTWSDLVEDGYGRGLGIVCASPIYDKGGKMRGVAGVSMLLTELSDTITNEDLGSTAFTFAINSRGDTVIMPGLTKISDSINLLDADNPELREMARRMVNGETGFAEITFFDEEVYAAYSPLTSIDWSICTVIGVDEILQLALHNDEQIINYTEAAAKQIDDSIMVMIIALLFFILIAVVLIFLFSSVFSKWLTKPIVSLTEAVLDYGGNDELVYRSEIFTGDEIQELSETFESVTERIAGYIENITNITAEKERIGAELDVAAKIQLSALPRVFPAFPERTEFDIYATMTPAKQVGGDFYDFFLVDDDHLAVVIADVSGNGIPAAMFMMMAKTYIKTNACIGMKPKDVFAAANNSLCENNDAEMFVTAFMGILEISTGKLTYANAGHNPPLIKRGNGGFEWLKVRAHFVLGGMEDVRYTESELYLGKGDMLFLYTDGVNEAEDENEEFYGNIRLEQALNELRDASPKALIDALMKRLDIFVKDAEQTDDIAMTALQYFPPKRDEIFEMILPADKDNLQALLDKVDVLLEKQGCSPKAQYQINVCIEEIFVNIASYAYGGKAGPVKVRCKFRAADDGSRQAVFTFRDQGMPYNPLNRDDPDITLDAEEREIGGLGVFMTQKMMDKTEYKYKGENIVRIFKTI